MATQRSDTDQYRELFLNDTPMIDVRAPVEFSKGAFPSAVNLPLLSDEERHQVGICYKEQGQDAAIELGHRFFCGETKEQRVSAWREFVDKHPHGYLYCFRGGLRSQFSQQSMVETGAPYPLVLGGYKAMRRFLIDELESICQRKDFVVVAGPTGSGKTRVIEVLEGAVDLEGLANHRGSAFGRKLTPQPSQINFENALAIELLKLDYNCGCDIFLEDESRLIGSCALPQILQDKMVQAPRVLVDEGLESRMDLILEEYIEEPYVDYQNIYGEEADKYFAADFLNSLSRIKKRLGGENYKKVSQLLEQALAEQANNGEIGLHKEWVAFLMNHYYDPMYDYQMNKWESNILFKGSRTEVVHWANDYFSKTLNS